MDRLRLTRNLRTLALLLAMAALVAGVWALWWANHTGLPESWRTAIEQQMAKQGAHVELGSLRFVPHRGIVATDVRVFSEPEHIHEISRLERVVLDFDTTKLARGQVELNKIELDDAQLDLPVDPDDPFTEILHVTGASGEVLMPGGRRIEVRDARGRIAGIDFIVDARIIGYRQDGPQPPDDSYIRRRRELLAKVLGELQKWDFDPERPPQVRMTLEGDVNDLTTLEAKLAVTIHGMGRNGHVIDRIDAQADMSGDLLTVTSLEASDRRGKFSGHIDYNMRSREGRFDVDSSLEIPRLLTAWAGLPAVREVTVRGRQRLEAEGGFQLDEAGSLALQLTGHARCGAVDLAGIRFRAVEGAFAWRDGNFFLRDARLERDDGLATAKLMIRGPEVKLALHSTLPVEVYRPLFPGQPLARVIADFSSNPGAQAEVALEGGFHRDDPGSWSYTGSGDLRETRYRGVPVHAARCSFALDRHALDFYDGTVEFDYSDYPLHRAHGGAARGTAEVGRIRYDAGPKLVVVENVRGAMWAAPMVRFFAPQIADGLEVYRFHEPPELAAGGVVDVTPQGRTALEVDFSSLAPADYTFLGEDLRLAAPRGRVLIRGDRVTVEDLRLGAFGGPVTARFEARGGRLAGELGWTKLALGELATTYGFEMKGGGELTGRIEFAMTGGKVATLDGEGLLAVENAELFSVPMFGPLTPLIANVLNDEEAGTQRARHAFCTFTIRDGILRSNDFSTATNSLNFTGEGTVDLDQRTLDMTLRMNARGLLRLITLPLRPSGGLFQFHGSGPLQDTRWERMNFSEPPADQRESLLAPPRARIVRDPD